MNKLIDVLLAFLRLGRAELHTKRVALSSLIAEVRSELAHLVDGRTVDWRISSVGEVEADPLLLRQALANLVSNALKYSRGHEQAVIEVRHDLHNSQDRIIVKDNGVGSDEEYASKLIGVFQRFHKEEEFERTGIGLATVKRIIARHGGTVFAEGREGLGATFTIYLPRLVQEEHRV